MNTHTPASQKTNRRMPKMTNNRLRLVAIIATLIVAAIAVVLRVESPAVWTFLGLVITAVLGQANNELQ